jgi:methylated-DNA-[protein]-cysteine S-methyltransferase
MTITAERDRTVVDSPVGPLTLGFDGNALCELAFAGRERRRASAAFAEPDPGLVDAVAEQLDAYFAGTLTEFDIPLHLDGTAFHRQVWSELLRIPYGTTLSYGELAERIGRPQAVRAVGRANGQNPIAIIVPCHRVIGSDGSLTGYGGGLETKQRLLELERIRLL